MKVGDIAIVTSKSLEKWVGARVRIEEALNGGVCDYVCSHVSGPWPWKGKAKVWFFEIELAQVSPLQLLAECADSEESSKL